VLKNNVLVIIFLPELPDGQKGYTLEEFNAILATYNSIGEKVLKQNL
jgi:mannonate dehydratase